MLNKRINITILGCLLFLLSVTDIRSQETLYKVNITFGGGYSYYISSLQIDKLKKFQPGFTTRIMWQPEHKLRVGIESGYQKLYSLFREGFFSPEYGTTDVDLRLSAIPILLVFSMEIHPGVEIDAGIGEYILLTYVNSYNNTVVSYSFTNGFLLGGSYHFPLTNSLQIGATFRWLYFSKIEDALTSLQFSVKYTLLSY